MKGKIPYDKALLIAVLALLGFGLVMVFSTSTATSLSTHTFSRQAVFVAIGLAAMLLTMQLDYHYYSRPIILYVLLGGALVMLVAVLFFPEIKGAHRWIVWGGLRAQPSEPAKLVMILFTAFYVSRKKDQLNHLKNGLLPYACLLGAVVGLILVEPDLGTAATLALTCSVLLFLGGLQFRYMLAAVLAAVPLLYILVLSVPYRRTRLLAFLNPEADAQGPGYQILQSLIAVGSGGIGGLGFTQSRQKLHFLPESNTDFVYAIIGEELGLIGCGLLVAVFLFLFWRGAKIALRADTEFGTLVGLGIICLLVMQALINMSVVVQLLPTKGIPLPFISVGGSSMVTSLAAVGILLNISRFSRGGLREAVPEFLDQEVSQSA